MNLDMLRDLYRMLLERRIKCANYICLTLWVLRHFLFLDVTFLSMTNG